MINLQVLWTTQSEAAEQTGKGSCHLGQVALREMTAIRQVSQLYSEGHRASYESINILRDLSSSKLNPRFLQPIQSRGEIPW